MLTVEQRERASAKGETPFGREAYLVINGEVIEGSETHVLRESGRFGYVWDDSAVAQLAKYKFEELASHFTMLNLDFNFEWNDLPVQVEIRFRDFDGENLQRLRFEFRVDSERWAIF